jgi:hypothetical protein
VGAGNDALYSIFSCQTQEVAVPADRVDQGRRSGKFDLSAEIADVDIHEVGERIGLRFPCPLGKLGAPHDMTGVTHQDLKDHVLLPREVDRDAAPGYPVAGGVQRKIARSGYCPNVTSSGSSSP